MLLDEVSRFLCSSSRIGFQSLKNQRQILARVACHGGHENVSPDPRPLRAESYEDPAARLEIHCRVCAQAVPSTAVAAKN